MLMNASMRILGSCLLYYIIRWKNRPVFIIQVAHQKMGVVDEEAAIVL